MPETLSRAELSSSCRALEVFRDWYGDYRYRLIADDGHTERTSPSYPTRACARRLAEAEAQRLGITTILEDE